MDQIQLLLLHVINKNKGQTHALKLQRLDLPEILQNDTKTRSNKRPCDFYLQLEHKLNKKRCRCDCILRAQLAPSLMLFLSSPSIWGIPSQMPVCWDYLPLSPSLSLSVRPVFGCCIITHPQQDKHVWDKWRCLGSPSDRWRGSERKKTAQPKHSHLERISLFLLCVCVSVCVCVCV